MATTVSINMNTEWHGDAFQLLYALQYYKQADLYRQCEMGLSDRSAICAQQVSSLKKQDNSWGVALNIPGLVGLLGVLPQEDQKLVTMKDASVKAANQALFNIFHRELIMRSYQSWFSHRLLLNYRNRNDYENKSQQVYSSHSLLTHLAGHPSSRTSIDDFMVSHALLFRKKYISASTLESLLRSYLRLPLRVKSFSAHYHTVPKSQLSRLSASPNQNQLGHDVRLGQSLWVYQNQMKINIGPLNFTDYRACLPGGNILFEIKKLIKKLVPYSIEVRAQLFLSKSAWPALGMKNNQIQLGRTAWLYTQTVKQDMPGSAFCIC